MLEKQVGHDVGWYLNPKAGPKQRTIGAGWLLGDGSVGALKYDLLNGCGMT